MPNEGIALCRRVDRSGMEERHETEVQDEPVLGAKHLIARGERGASSLQWYAVLCRCLVISVIEPIGSNRLLDAIRRYRISQYCRPPTIDHGSTIFWGGQDEMQNQRLGRWI
jgi:hypothetical protein